MQNRLRFVSALVLASLVGVAAAQGPSRGKVAFYPVMFDDSGTPTSRDNTRKAGLEALRKGGYTLLADDAAARAWRSSRLPAASYRRPPTVQQMVRFGRAAKVDFVISTQVHFHTRSIWVNLGPKTISTADVYVTIVNAKTGQLDYQGEYEGRSDERTEALKAVGAVLISPLVTAVSGGPKTPQETRAGQIAMARALSRFVGVPTE